MRIHYTQTPSMIDNPRRTISISNREQAPLMMIYIQSSRHNGDVWWQVESIFNRLLLSCIHRYNSYNGIQLTERCNRGDRYLCGNSYSVVEISYISLVPVQSMVGSTVLTRCSNIFTPIERAHRLRRDLHNIQIEILFVHRRQSLLQYR